MSGVRLGLTVAITIGAVWSSEMGAGSARAQECLVWQDVPPLHPPGPGPMAYDSRRTVTILFMGGETWEWDGVTWVLRATDGPPPQPETTLAYDSRREIGRAHV